MSGYHEGAVVMVDLNQLVRDSLQIARSTWFQGFRRTRDRVDLRADLHPVPALPARASDLRIALLCLLRHAMDAVRRGDDLIVRTTSVDEGEGPMVAVSFSDGSGPSSAVEREDGIGILLRQVHTSESRRALAFVQALIRNLDGRITVQRSANGGTTTALIFSVSRTVDGEP
jgi:C4-dicarboxylate-specific signal transduction histidine kinase